ncbi:MAG: hypothetical protein PHW02_08695, partial [bacterium]|nr:hypothetical protein [bacterium]
MKKVFLISITVIFCALMLPAESYWEEYASCYDPSITLPSFGENQITANGDSLNCRLLGRPMFGSCGCATAKGEYAFAGFGYSMLSFEIS